MTHEVWVDFCINCGKYWPRFTQNLRGLPKGSTQQPDLHSTQQVRVLFCCWKLCLCLGGTQRFGLRSSSTRKSGKIFVSTEKKTFQTTFHSSSSKKMWRLIFVTFGNVLTFKRCASGFGLRMRLSGTKSNGKIYVRSSSLRLLRNRKRCLPVCGFVVVRLTLLALREKSVLRMVTCLFVCFFFVVEASFCSVSNVNNTTVAAVVFSFRRMKSCLTLWGFRFLFFFFLCRNCKFQLWFGELL